MGFIDFDAFRAEQRAEPLVVKVGGQDYNLPASPPADVAFDLIRRISDDKTTISIPPKELPALAESLFGKDMYDELVHRHRLTVEEIGWLISEVMSKYQTDAAPPPNREGRRAMKRKSPSTSSGRGTSSRRTSSASTGSISPEI